MSAGHYHATMMLLFSLALWLSLPPPPEPEPGTQPSASQQVTLWATEQKEAGRTLEALGSRTTTRPAVSPSDGGSDVTVATFLDRTGGCVRGWARLTLLVPKLGAAPTRTVEELAGAACDAPPLPLNHFLRFVHAIAQARWQEVATFAPGSLQFPIGIELNAKLSRKTYDGTQILTGEVPFPTCDPLDDTPSCQSPRPSGRTTCTCAGPRHEVEIDFQIDPTRPKDTPQLVSIREKVLVQE